MKARPVTRRNTRQRAAIRGVFESNPHPLTIHEVYGLAEKAVSGLGIATVYRTVGSLSDQGVLSTVEIPGEPPRYELAGKAHHHHFRCRRCKRVFEIGGCPEGIACLAPAGFRIEGHEILLTGLCPDCAAPGQGGGLRRRK